MAINWARGMKRSAYALLALIWLAVIGLAFTSGPAEVGYAIGQLLIFSLVYLVVMGIIFWAAKGFGDSKTSDATDK